jgi:hypothetical protein
MEVVRHLLLLLHLLGFGALFGGAFVQVRDRAKVVNTAMLHGILTQIVTGIALVGVIESQDDPINHAKVVAKFAVGVTIGVLCWINRSRIQIPDGLFWLITTLAIANAGIAVLWT